MTAGRIAARRDEVLTRVGLEGERKRPLNSFSKGMLQRAGLAQALLGDPDLYRESPERVGEINSRLQQLESELAESYRRWEALEG